MKDIKKYIEHQLSKLNANTEGASIVYSLNAIYAVLESKGYRRSFIKTKIDEVILETLHCLKIDLQSQIQNFYE